ncbi:hypothetical protein OW763_09155 [Clostridium aestuarii]|uniref:Uncharacterized protein n=1 Tax=Clostridium aestuarii TaxID=338193 RepID=A0ABT4CZU2_9CLOT|nr:hypothetical protein [Clostridium aestuarii]MCY6484506.1 hypothetical protein [Clostridium aestuarii]
MDYKKEIEKLKQYIDDSEIVSFDIFDTLLLRNVVKPSDIFKVVEIKYFNKYKEKINFFKIRISSENIARKRSEYEDVSLDDIYENIEEKLGDIANHLKKLEIECEKNFLIPNSCMQDVYNYAKQKNKKVIMISDMYLSKTIVKELLQLNGYTEYDGLYISSEVKKTKATRSLYSYIREEMNISKNAKWIHIGDNYQSDIINAQKEGIKGIYYKKLIERENIPKINNLSDSIIYSVQINTKYYKNDYNYWDLFGVQYVSSIYIGLMFDLLKWLKDKDNIYFLARDGYVPFKLYNKLKKHYPNLPLGKYLYASRRAYIYPSLIDKKDEAIDILTIYNSGFNQKLNIKEIFNNLGLDSNNYLDILGKYCLNNLEERITDKNIYRVKKMLEEIWSDINRILKKEKDILIKYLNQEGVMDYNTVNIFDIGWAGSTHKAIVNLINKNVNGYYFGTIESIDKQIKDKAFGYAFNNGHPMKNRNFIIDNAMIYEFIFTAPEGSLKTFKHNKYGAVIPDLVDIQNQSVYSCIEKVQDGAYDVFEKILKYIEYLEMESPSKEFILHGMENFINKKNVLDMMQFEKIYNSVSIGESKDVKPYVIRLDYNEYLNNRNYYKRKSLFNLWRGAILIEDNQGRLFNMDEFDKLSGLSIMYEVKIKLSTLVNMCKKAIKDPQKAIKKIFNLIKYIFIR